MVIDNQYAPPPVDILHNHPPCGGHPAWTHQAGDRISWSFASSRFVFSIIDSIWL